MSDWLNELPFAWVLVVALALFYIAATAIYTRVMILVTDRSHDAFAKREKQQTRVEPPKSVITRPTPVSPILRAHDGEVAAVAWDCVTSGEIELMKRLLVTYRAELLAHHAEELSALDEQQAEVEALERSICAFAEKYNRTRGRDGGLACSAAKEDPGRAVMGGQCRGRCDERGPARSSIRNRRCRRDERRQRPTRRSGAIQ